MAISTPEQPRDRRFQLRTTGAAREKAQEALADQTRFVLNDQQWKLFMKALDRPAKEKPRLKKLFTESHIAERRS